MYDYQNLLFYQKQVKSWDLYQIQNDSIIIKDNNIKEDLEDLHLMLYSKLFLDVNNDTEIDFEQDSVVFEWQSAKPSVFNLNDYISHGDAFFIADSVLNINTDHLLYTSYGEYGQNFLPATYVEMPIQNKYIGAFWFVLDYPLPYDIYWPEIILTISIILIIVSTALIIRKFLQPIKDIKTHVRGLKKGNLSSTISISSNDELGQLATTINRMTLEINRLVNQKHNLLIDVSHELKTPLTRLKFIIANMEINKENKVKLNKEVNFLKDLISNMLFTDKLSTPYIEDLELGNILVSDLIQNACDMFYQIDKKLLIINNIKDPIYLSVDRYKMSLAIKNLIDNSIKYGSSDKRTEMIINADDKCVSIEVKDFGNGITKEQIKKITKPLYRGSNAKEKNKSGFGLGLAITKKIVEAHKGQLKIKSKINSGSKFIITVPIGE
tara:strand:+ start:18764 stop:20077 length:1314 start_codon:yes stop_codon:yes gene_type:complete